VASADRPMCTHALRNAATPCFATRSFHHVASATPAKGCFYGVARARWGCLRRGKLTALWRAAPLCAHFTKLRPEPESSDGVVTLGGARRGRERRCERGDGAVFSAAP
jgi:hypothetical protein